jgi:hypothetical protein
VGGKKMKFDVEEAIEEILVEGFSEGDLLRAVLSVLPKGDIEEILNSAEDHLFAEAEEAESEEDWDSDEDEIDEEEEF